MASKRQVIGLIGILWSFASGYAQQQPDVNPIDLVRRAAKNEIRANENQKYFFMYKDHSQSKNHSITKEVLETPQGGLARTIAINGKPLTAEQRSKDDQKLTKFANDPEARRKKEESSKEEDKRAELMLTSLPDAFLYTYAGTERGRNGEPMVHLKFTPNPKFDPPNHETAVYQGMQGGMTIDEEALRIAKIDGTLFRDVDFGWGILGRLYKGGRFIIEQQDVGNGRWETVRQVLQFNGKILLVKSLTIDSTETATDFRPVPSNITTAEALNLLHKSTDTVAENGGGVKEADSPHR
ncbi:MAG: hypothetical protein P4M04_03375 [Acidobacteriota bacterium]|nr:hypothetical protein [Acidobacteriota bacterium]